MIKFIDIALSIIVLSNILFNVYIVYLVSDLIITNDLVSDLIIKDDMLKNGDLVLNGYYDTKGYYCVKTDGRSIEDIASTDNHEKCHYLIDKNYYHFCEEYYNE